MPLSRRQEYGHLNAVRDLQREMDDLSDEETEVYDLVCSLSYLCYFLLLTSTITEH